MVSTGNILPDGRRRDEVIADAIARSNRALAIYPKDAQHQSIVNRALSGVDRLLSNPFSRLEEIDGASLLLLDIAEDMHNKAQSRDRAGRPTIGGGFLGGTGRGRM